MGKSKRSFFLFYYNKFLYIVLIVTILLTFFDILAAQEKQNIRLIQGLEDYKSGNYLGAIGNLEAALYKDLSNEDAIRANLFLGLSYLAVNNNEKGKAYFKSAIRLNPKLELDPSFPENAIAIFNESINDLPIIYQLKIFPEVFSPYSGEGLWLEFNLSHKADITFSISNGSLSFINLKENGKDGFNAIHWNWSDKLLVSGEYKYDLEARDYDKDNFKIIKNVNLQVNIPEPLKYISGEFIIPGQKFKQEYTLGRSLSEQENREYSTRVTKPLLLGIGCFGLGLAGIYISKNSKEEGTQIVVSIGAAAAFLYGIYSTFEALVNLPSVSRSKVIKEPIKENIEYNNKLREEIERLKTNITVKQKLAEKENSHK